MPKRYSVCLVEPCSRRTLNEMCSVHRPVVLCRADGCVRPRITKGYCTGHYGAHLAGRPIKPLRTGPLILRVLYLIDKSDQCWTWQGLLDEEGYGRITGNGKRHIAHRLVYEHFVGAIPDGLVIDHKCRNRGCVNPAHLEPVTHRVNILRGVGASAKNARKTRCLRGHVFNKPNTRIRADGSRQCRDCARGYVGRPPIHSLKAASPRVSSCARALIEADEAGRRS